MEIKTHPEDKPETILTFHGFIWIDTEPLKPVHDIKITIPIPPLYHPVTKVPKRKTSRTIELLSSLFNKFVSK